MKYFICSIFLGLLLAACGDLEGSRGDPDAFDLTFDDTGTDQGGDGPPSDAADDIVDPPRPFHVQGGTVTGSAGIVLSQRFTLIGTLAPIPNEATSTTYRLHGGISQ